jgi:hypothetical protein
MVNSPDSVVTSMTQHLHCTTTKSPQQHHRHHDSEALSQASLSIYITLWPSHPSSVIASMTRHLLAVKKYIYLPSTYLPFIQDIENRCLLLTRFTNFVDLPFQERQMMKKHHMNQNSYISSLCPKPGVVTDNMTRGTMWHQAWAQPSQSGASRPHPLSRSAKVWHLFKICFHHVSR